MKKILMIMIMTMLSLSACSSKTEVEVKADKEVITNKDIVLETLESTKSTNDNVTESANIIYVDGMEINVLDYIEDTSEYRFLDYLCDNGNKMVIWGGLDETVKSRYSAREEAKNTDKNMYDYYRPPYIYKSPEGNYSLDARSDSGLVYYMRKDETGFQSTFIASLFNEEDAIGNKRLTLQNLSNDTTEKLENLFERVVQTTSGYACHSGRLEQDSYEINASIQMDGDNVDYIDYRVTFKNMGEDFKNHMENTVN